MEDRKILTMDEELVYKKINEIIVPRLLSALYTDMRFLLPNARKALFSFPQRVLFPKIPMEDRKILTMDEELVYKKINEIIVRMGLDKKEY